MHKTSYKKVEAFYESYVHPYLLEQNEEIKILDIGSKKYGKDSTYKEIFQSEKIKYVGLDLSEGENVDIVTKNSFLWEEIQDEEFDICISGQSFEHNPFFWITFAEMARVIKQKGMIFTVAPGRGPVHRVPFDCYRFFPDSWLALCIYCGLNLIESYFEEYKFKRVESGSFWCDSCIIAQKPCFLNENEKYKFYNQIKNITKTLPSSYLDIFSNEVIFERQDTPFINNYERRTKVSAIKALRVRLMQSPTRIVKTVLKKW